MKKNRSALAVPVKRGRMLETNSETFTPSRQSEKVAKPDASLKLPEMRFRPPSSSSVRKA